MTEATTSFIKTLQEVFWRGARWILVYAIVATIAALLLAFLPGIIATASAPSSDSGNVVLEEISDLLINHATYSLVALLASVTIIVSSFFLGLYTILSFITKRGTTGSEGMSD